MLRLRRRKTLGTLVLFVSCLLAGSWIAARRIAGGPRREGPSDESLPTATVRRADIWATVTTAGFVESAKRTVIECRLESFDLGRPAAGGGASTILELVPEGTIARKGDVLCRLDSSDYEEMARLQEMTVQQAASEHHQSELDLEVARLAAREFQEGIRLQTEKDLRGRIALAQSESERAQDRVTWARRMFVKGYLSLGQVANETLAARRAAFGLAQSRTSFEVFQRHVAPRTYRQLENGVLAAEAVQIYHLGRLQAHRDRLTKLRRQVDACTIRAPHDGLVIHANDPRRQLVIEAGIPVRQRQPLFYLPDLTQLEISALLHESVVDKVREGMRARAEIEGLPNRVLEGHVLSVDVLPTRNPLSAVSYYVARIEIDSLPAGLRPGMSAEVRIATARRPDVLTIPPAALAVEEGQEVCYVSGDEGLERREVKVGESSRNDLEVTEGLSEGEHVVLDPRSLDPAVAGESAALADRDASEPPESSSTIATH